MEGEVHSVSSQRDHAEIGRTAPQIICRAILHDHVAQLIVHNHQLEQANATLVAGVVAILAALATIEFLVAQFVDIDSQVHQNLAVDFGLFTAFAADATHQPLRQNGFDAGCNQERRNPHIFHARNRARRVVGVQGAEHQVTGQRSLHGNLRRFQIANLADQNGVRILPQDRSQARGKRNTDVMIDRNLHNAIDVILNGILGRNQFVFNRIQFTERRVEGRGLARTRRTRHQYNTVRSIDDLAEDSQHRFVHAHVGQVQ